MRHTDPQAFDVISECTVADSISYMLKVGLLDMLRADAREADDLHSRSRRLLVTAVRTGAAAGLSQREISNAVGRSQPEVSRLLRFHGRSPLARALETNRSAVIRSLSDGGAKNVRVFGSVSRGDDGPDSDIDLLVDFEQAPSLFALSRLEDQLSGIIGAPVDVVPSSGLRPHLAEAVLAEAVPL